MGCQNECRILAEGLSTLRTQFKNVEFDLTPEEKKHHSSFTYKAEPAELNSAEMFNIEQRKKYAVKSYDFEEFQSVYRTREYKYEKVSECLNVIKYLFSVLDLASFINDGISSICAEQKEIRKNKNLSKDDIRYQILKNTVNGYIDILIEVKTRKDDFYYSAYSHYFRKSYEELDSYSRLIMTSHAVPDEMSVSFNSLYDGIPLNKFSSQKELGMSKSACLINFSQFADKLYTIIHIFLSNLINEFSAYVTSDVFLNNPEGKTIFIIPLSMYKKFNFLRSGLTRQEVVFIDVPNNPEKTAQIYSAFFNEIHDTLLEFQKKSTTLKNSLMTVPDSKELEWFLEAFARKFEGITEGRIGKVQELCRKNSAFREKLTCMVYEIKSDMVEMLKNGGNPWEIIDKNPEVDLKKFDRDTCHFINVLCRMYFGDEEMPISQLQRVFHVFDYQTYPEKAMSSHMKKLTDRDSRWASDRKDDFIELLNR